MYDLASVNLTTTFWIYLGYYCLPVFTTLPGLTCLLFGFFWIFEFAPVYDHCLPNSAFLNVPLDIIVNITVNEHTFYLASVSTPFMPF